MLDYLRLTQTGNERILFVMLHYRETVCCLPSYPTRKASGSGHLLVGLLHFGLRPVQQDRLRICPLQCRQRQQNISLTCAHKAGLSFAKIPNWDGLSRQMSEPKWTKSKLRQTFQRLSSTTEGWAKVGQADRTIFHTKPQPGCHLFFSIYLPAFMQLLFCVRLCIVLAIFINIL